MHELRLQRLDSATWGWLSSGKEGPQVFPIASNKSQGMPPQLGCLSNFPGSRSTPPITEVFTRSAGQSGSAACCPTTAAVIQEADDCSRSRSRIRLQSSGGDGQVTAMALMRGHALIVVGHSSVLSTWSAMYELVSPPIPISHPPWMSPHRFGSQLSCS